MKFFEDSGSRKKHRRATAYIALFGCALAVFGAVKLSQASRSHINDSSNSSEKDGTFYSDESYFDTDSSYTDITEPDFPSVSQPTENTVSDAPYEEPLQAMIMPVDGEIIKDFSDSSLQFSATYNDLRLHAAADIACAAGTAVKSADAGEVTAVEESSTLGSYVTVAHRNGIEFKYCGLERITVAVGDKLEMGTPMGIIGAIPSECSDREHLHLEAYLDGKAISPIEVIQESE